MFPVGSSCRVFLMIQEGGLEAVTGETIVASDSGDLRDERLRCCDTCGEEGRNKWEGEQQLFHVPKGEVVRVGGGKGFCFFSFLGEKGSLDTEGEGRVKDWGGTEGRLCGAQ
jgi:hypothetical protein